MNEKKVGIIGQLEKFKEIKALIKASDFDDSTILEWGFNTALYSTVEFSLKIFLVDYSETNWFNELQIEYVNPNQSPSILIFLHEPTVEHYKNCFKLGINEVFFEQELTAKNFKHSILKAKGHFRESKVLIDKYNLVANEAKEVKDHSLAKSQLLANLSKDIRTPLNGIMGSIQLLLESRLDHEQRELSDLILNSSNNLLDALNGIIDRAKLEVGELALEFKNYDIENFLDVALGELYQTALKKGKQFVIKNEISKKSSFQIDFKRLQYLVFHLAEWTLSANESGSVSIGISELDHGILKFTFSDEAIDIFESDLGIDSDYLFDTRLMDFDLGYCFELAGLMGGELISYTKNLQSLKYELTIEAERVKEEIIEKSNKKEVRNYLGRVVVAEDNLINQKVITKLLNSLGIKPIIAYNGKVALEEVQKEPTDLVLMDIQMPIMNGFVATNAIRNLDPKIQQPIIVACSANVLEEVVNNSASLGMDGFLKKPLSKVNLIKELDKWLKIKDFKQLKDLVKADV